MILRSFVVRGNPGTLPREGHFQARVTEFLGVAPRPDGFAILTLCDEPVWTVTGLKLPSGYAASANGPRWDFFIRVDGEERPAGRRIRSTFGENFGKEGVLETRFLGGVAFGDGVAFVFVTLHEAPEGVEFVVQEESS